MKNKFGTILLSLIIAFGLWYYVITVVSPDSEETFYNIPVVFEGESVLEERGLMVTGIGNTNVTLTLSGNRSDLIQLSPSNITIKANLSTVYEPGENVQLGYTITYPGTVASNAFVEERRSPSTITVSVEKKISKDVDVHMVTVGELPEYFTALEEDLTMDQYTVRISGPKSVVDLIHQAVIEVSLDGQTESINGKYRITLCDADGTPVDAEGVTVSTEVIELHLPVRAVKTIELAVNVVDGGGASAKTTTITLNPMQIEVHGTVAALENLDRIVLGTIHLADYAEDTQLEFEIVLPEGVTNRTGLKVATVTLEFGALSTRTFLIEGSSIELRNVPEGMEAIMTTQMLEITVRGPAAEIATLELEDILASVDFVNAEPGSSSRKLIIAFDAEHKNCGALGSYSVYATVYEAEDTGAE